MALGTGRAPSHFAGRLQSATLTKQAATAIDASNPTAAPTGTSTQHACEGQAFAYGLRDIDGSRVIKGDFRVVLIRHGLSVTPQPGDTLSIPPPGSTTPQAVRVVAIEAVTAAQFTLQVRG